jgi:hypothetical protein
MSEKALKTIDDLTPDADNFNRHTEFGQKLLEDSLRKFGAGRSVLVDKDGNIIAGNGVVETAASIGMDKIKVVETDGTELVVVKRKDLTLDSPEGRELALADNMTALKGIDIDLEKVQEMLGDDMAKAWGMDIVEQQKREMQTKELKPFVKNHVLVSYPLDLHEKVMEAVHSLIGVEGVEIEQSAN